MPKRVHGLQNRFDPIFPPRHGAAALQNCGPAPFFSCPLDCDSRASVIKHVSPLRAHSCVCLSRACEMMGGGAKAKSTSRRSKRQLARLAVIFAVVCVVGYVRRAQLFPGAFGNVVVAPEDDHEEGWDTGKPTHGPARLAGRVMDDPAKCKARTTRYVNERWTEKRRHDHTVAVGSFLRDAAKISFAGPLVLNARLKRPPKVPKSNGEMEDLGALTAEQRRLLPERDILDTLHYESCAVVGNGGLLLMYEHGDIIDSHDAVIRFNDATTKEPFAKHAGSKTTIRLVNSQHRGGGG